MKKTPTALALLLAAALIFSSCGCAAQECEKTFFAMDTVMSVKVSGQNAQSIAQDCVSEAARLEKLFSATLPGSDIYRINAAAGERVQVAPETAELIEAALTVVKQTQGSLDIQLYALSRMWGFSSAAKEQRVPAEEEIAEFLSRERSLELTSEGVLITPGADIDLGAVAKGYTSQCLAQIIASGGASGVISLGGNVQTVGQKPDGSPYSIGIADPNDPEKVIGRLDVGECAAVTSGAYQRYFEQNGVRYHHILDPKTGAPAKSGLASVTVICDNGTRADALSTALFVMGQERGMALWREIGGFEAVFITQKGDITATAGLADKFVALYGEAVFAE